ncbi:MAG: DUF1800 domain-containing protein [Flavobacteriaceae bacterium]|nr:DUF1800 domain-containing protein [Flavobacteriaceae bacterium]
MTKIEVKKQENVKNSASVSTLNPYQGSWTKQEAAHLLRRTLFGLTIEQITNATAKGLAQTVTDLFTVPAIASPLNYDPKDPSVPIGQTWVGKPLPTANKNEAAQARHRSLRAWLVERTIQHQQFSVVEKVSLFWQNHFSCNSNSSDSQGAYEYLMLLRNNCLGDFKQLVKDMTIHPMMLSFLNGNTSTKTHPNENFARELFELYTIGKGPQIGNGDYTYYTEHDILESAKILTGWRFQDSSSSTLPLISSYFTEARHDNSDKTLSGKFENKVILGNNASEYSDLIDIIFQQDQVARFICKKLYIWFVKTEVNTTIVEGMAQTMIANNYEIAPVLRELFLSEHFYDIKNRGTIIKSPIEMVANLYKSTNSKLLDLNYSTEANYRILLSMNNGLRNSGMGYFQPPNVAGWTAYYLEPSFSELWINSSLISFRFNITNYVTLYGGYQNGGSKFPIDLLGFLNQLEQFSNPADAETLIGLLELIFTCKPLETNQRDELKNTLTDGLPDFEWTIEYNDYLANQSNATYADPVKKRIKLVLAQLFHMPEFQIQ